MESISCIDCEHGDDQRRSIFGLLMPNTTPIANVEIQLEDGLQAGIPPVLFRTVPPVLMPSNIQVAYNGYAYLTTEIQRQSSY